jgi:hypothetical protein
MLSNAENTGTATSILILKKGLGNLKKIYNYLSASNRTKVQKNGHK